LFYFQETQYKFGNKIQKINFAEFLLDLNRINLIGVTRKNIGRGAKITSQSRGNKVFESLCIEKQSGGS